MLSCFKIKGDLQANLRITKGPPRFSRFPLKATIGAVYLLVIFMHIVSNFVAIYVLLFLFACLVSLRLRYCGEVYKMKIR